jgi:hypothetical protein
MKKTYVMDVQYDWRGRACARGGTNDSAFLQKPRDQLMKQEYERQWKMLIAFNCATKGRQLAITRKGYLAMAPESAVAGDGIFAILGGTVLYTLRCQDESVRRYGYVGETYVYGLMDGEAMRWAEAGGAKIEELILV